VYGRVLLKKYIFQWILIQSDECSVRPTWVQLNFFRLKLRLVKQGLSLWTFYVKKKRKGEKRESKLMNPS